MSAVVLEQQTYEWNKLDWKQIQTSVFKLQKRIYRAEQRKDVKTIRKLQKLLISSWSAKLLAVRRITQDNQGKKTAGVDGVKSLVPQQRIKLAENLSLNEKATPVRRVWIPKAGKNEMRPLGIPTISERAKQTLIKFALEPVWEAKFEANSYGFRPGRSCWDAIGAIYNSIRLKSKWVLDADIAKCFDRINHQALLKKINASPKITRQIEAWLKAGVLDGKKLFATEEGAPQGSAISPLLANIALNGLETIIRNTFTVEKKLKTLPTVIVYADDFVCIHEDREIVEKCQRIISEWLAKMGLELNLSKTRITHTLKKDEQEAGFNFLGFNIRQYEVGKNRSGKNRKGERLGFKTIIKPSKESVKRHLKKIGQIIRKMSCARQEELIEVLNPVIRGWTNYYSTVCSRRTFERLSHMTWKKLQAWANRRHSNKGKKWTASRYWKLNDGKGWRFVSDNEITLFKHSETPIIRHVKIQGQRSPYDGDWVYWSARLGHFPEVKPRVVKLLKRQRGKCNWCRHYLREGDLLEIDHINPKGKDTWSNLQILHRHCHNVKTTQDRYG
jgi:RNA-directed DNA polymerase